MTTFDSRRLHLIDHPLAACRLSVLRAKTTPPATFRAIVRDLSFMLGYEALRTLPLEDVTITTPLEETKAQRIAGPTPVIVPILRAGMGMVDGLCSLLPEVGVGVVGMYRDEETHKAHQYYCKLPSDVAQRTCLIVDPMLATGGTLVDAIRLLRNADVEDIRCLTLVSAPEGLRYVFESDERVEVYTCAVDRCLNENAYILPGLGDAGDRIFATEV